MADERNINKRLEDAIVEGNVELVEAILDEQDVNGVDVNLPLYDDTQETPLLLAIDVATKITPNEDYELDEDSVEIIHMLLDYGANANGIHDATGENEQDIPLFVAVQIKNKDLRNAIVDILLESGADANIVGLGEETPLHRVADNKNYITADILLRHGARMDLENDNSETVRVKHPELLDEIEKAKPDSNYNRRRRLIEYRIQERAKDPRRQGLIRDDRIIMLQRKIKKQLEKLEKIELETEDIKDKLRTNLEFKKAGELRKQMFSLYGEKPKIQRELRRLQKELEDASATHSGGKRHSRRKSRKQRRVKKKRTMKHNVKKTARRKKSKQSKKTRRRRRR